MREAEYHGKERSRPRSPRSARRRVGRRRVRRLPAPLRHVPRRPALRRGRSVPDPESFCWRAAGAAAAAAGRGGAAAAVRVLDDGLAGSGTAGTRWRSSSGRGASCGGPTAGAARRWDAGAAVRVPGPLPYACCHATVPQLIEAGDVDLLRALPVRPPAGRAAGRGRPGPDARARRCTPTSPRCWTSARDGVDLTVAATASARTATARRPSAAFHGKVRVPRRWRGWASRWRRPARGSGRRPRVLRPARPRQQLRAAAASSRPALARFLWMGPARRRLLARRHAPAPERVRGTLRPAPRRRPRDGAGADVWKSTVCRVHPTILH